MVQLGDRWSPDFTPLHQNFTLTWESVGLSSLGEDTAGSGEAWRNLDKQLGLVPMCLYARVCKRELRVHRRVLSDAWGSVYGMCRVRPWHARWVWCIAHGV